MPFHFKMTKKNETVGHHPTFLAQEITRDK